MVLPVEFLDTLVEPVLVFEPAGRLRHANRAAMRRMPVEPGMALADLGTALGTPLQAWVQQTLQRDGAEAAPRGMLVGPGPVLMPGGDGTWLLSLPAGTVLRPDAGAGPEVREIVRLAPFPATLQDEQFRLVDVNEAYVALTGHARDELIGRDPLDFLPPDQGAVAQRERTQRDDPAGWGGGQPQTSCLIDASGAVRWVRVSRCVSRRPDGRRWWLTMWQDTTSEQAAREQAERVSRELDQWFDLGPMGMVLFDEKGLVLRANPAFEHLAGGALVELADAPAAVRALLQWEGDGMVIALLPGRGWISREGTLPGPDGVPRRVRALLRCHEVRAGRRRYMGMLEDRAVEDERDARQRAQAQAEQLLVELSTILESSPAGIASLRGFTLVRGNRRFERMLRLPAGRLTGADLREILAERAMTIEAAEPVERMLCGRDRYEAEVAVRIDDGTVQWFALTVRRTGPAGAAPQAIVVLSDITRLKSQQVQLEHLASEHGRMARVLGQQVDRTRAVLDSVLVGIVTVDEGGRIAWLNRSARRMFGGDLGDFLGQSLDTVASEESDHPFRRTLSMVEALRDGEAVQFECRVQARDGRDFWVVGNAVATLGAQGERELTWALMDIDQRRQAEARIAEARASLQHIIEAAPMAIAVCDAVTLAVLHVNRVAEALMAGDVLVEAIGGGEPCRPTPPAVVLRDDLRVALARPDAVTQREYTLRRQGTNEVWDARFLPLGRAGGAIDQILLVATDVTVQRAAQRAELQAAIAQREMLVQEVHHRIKNNLQGVAGLMQQAALQHPEVRPVIAEVVGQVQAIAQVYGLQVGRVGLLAVHSVIEAIAQSVQRMFGRVITVAVAGPDRVRWVLPENESIPIALTLNELFTNAVKHAADAAPVQCTLVLGETAVAVEIANRGRLPDGFSLERRPSAVSGLGLVRALLPRRQAGLTLAQRGEEVVAAVTLAPPVVVHEPVDPEARAYQSRRPARQSVIEAREDDGIQHEQPA